MAIQSVDQVRCVGCGNCVENCPMDVFRLDEDTGKAQVVYPEDCAMCFICYKEFKSLKLLSEVTYS